MEGRRIISRILYELRLLSFIRAIGENIGPVTVSIKIQCLSECHSEFQTQPAKLTLWLRSPKRKRLLIFLIDLPFRFAFALIGFTFMGWIWSDWACRGRGKILRRHPLAHWIISPSSSEIGMSEPQVLSMPVKRTRSPWWS
jgi:hypothetical protein